MPQTPHTYNGERSAEDATVAVAKDELANRGIQTTQSVTFIQQRLIGSNQ
jgi:hypothetical protein